jgi:hypothetical protein
MHATEVPFGKGREDDLHKVLLRLASRVARFDAFYDCIHWNALGRISHVFLVPRYHFLAKPLFHSRVPLQQCPYAVAYDLANGRIGSRLNFALYDLSHIEWQCDAELLCGSHIGYSEIYHNME